MIERVRCRKCEAMILEVTARRNGGCCGVCARTRGVKAWVMNAGAMVMVLALLVAMPFLLVGVCVRSSWRRWRFPFDGRAMRARIRAVHGEKRVARFYFDGVIDGYWAGDDEVKRVKRYPPHAEVEERGDGDLDGDEGSRMLVMDENRPRFCGLRDGARLRRGEVGVEEIPTYRERLVLWVRSRGGARCA